MELIDKQSLPVRAILAAERGIRRLLRGLGWSDRAIWRFGLLSEIYYWNAHLRSVRERSLASETPLFELDPEAELQPNIQALIAAPEGALVRILDVGAGPLSVLGKRWEGRTVEMTAVDPLARTYAWLLERHHVVPPVQTTPGDAESLQSTFPRDHFDLAFAQNCLDHGYDPLLSIRQILAVVKPGGHALLGHQVDEGKRQQYSGLHQWDFSVEEGHFTISGPSGTRDVTRELHEIAETRCQLQRDGTWLDVTLRKR